MPRPAEPNAAVRQLAMSVAMLGEVERRWEERAQRQNVSPDLQQEARIVQRMVAQLKMAAAMLQAKVPPSDEQWAGLTRYWKALYALQVEVATSLGKPSVTEPNS